MQQLYRSGGPACRRSTPLHLHPPTCFHSRSDVQVLQLVPAKRAGSGSLHRERHAVQLLACTADKSRQGGRREQHAGKQKQMGAAVLCSHFGTQFCKQGSLNTISSFLHALSLRQIRQQRAHQLQRCSIPRCRSRQWPPTGCHLQVSISKRAIQLGTVGGTAWQCYRAGMAHARRLQLAPQCVCLVSTHPPASIVMPSGTALCPLGAWTTARPSSLPSGPRCGIPCRNGMRQGTIKKAVQQPWLRAAGASRQRC